MAGSWPSLMASSPLVRGWECRSLARAEEGAWACAMAEEGGWAGKPGGWELLACACSHMETNCGQIKQTQGKLPQ